MKRILISGASISGPALAWWLARSGFSPTLVERAPGRTRGGHAIDVRGAALKVLRAMALEDAVRESRTRMKGVSILDSAGVEVWRSEDMTISGGRFDNDDIEILRDDISNLIVDVLPAGVETIYGDSITSIAENGDAVSVTFEKGGEREFDLVIGADGLRSNVRKLAFGEDAELLRPLGIALAPFSIPNRIAIEDWQISYKDGDDSCLIYTARDNSELRVCFGFAAGMKDFVADRAGQMALVRQKCGHMGWEVPGFLSAMEQSPDFYLGIVAQVKMPAWSRGRIAVVGDAGYCPSPYSGQGTSLALVGAYVLARELASSPDDHAAAFSRYEERLRPYVEANHAIVAITQDERFSDPAYMAEVVEPAMEKAKNAIDLPELD